LAARVCRVVPDVTALDRAFDYRIDADAPVGTIVRVPLHGRRVRGWITALDVEPESENLLDVLAVVSAGPPAEVVELTEWIAWRWAGPRVAVLRSASPPNIAPVSTVCAVVPPIGGTTAQTVVRWPPLRDRREFVASLCADTGSTLVCIADAGRARTFASYLRETGRRVALLHSVESDAARTAAWRVGAEGNCIVVGGRIAALAPVPDLAAAILMDDADEALQEERAPTWHARDVLRERAARAAASFTICSPVPTIEALVARPGQLELPSTDVERAGWPRVQIVDRREEPPGAGLLTSALADALHRSTGLAVCLLNRRGRFRLLVCQNQHLLRWESHDERPDVCPECGSTKLRVLRAGVTRIREELEALLPNARVTDVDATTEVVPDADVVIGTEAVLHRTAIRRRRPTLIAYLDLDQELLAPRYRALSQAHWLVTRGAQALAARPRDETMLLMQTRMPDHVVVQSVANATPDDVIAAEHEYRETLGYPPFGALAELSGDGEALDATLEALHALDIAATGIQVFGPHEERALVHAPDWEPLANALHRCLPVGRALGRVRAVVDPARV
jgi:primosomal protein N' (replication factor Y)